MNSLKFILLCTLALLLVFITIPLFTNEIEAPRIKLPNMSKTEPENTTIALPEAITCPEKVAVYYSVDSKATKRLNDDLVYLIFVSEGNYTADLYVNGEHQEISIQNRTRIYSSLITHWWQEGMPEDSEEQNTSIQKTFHIRLSIPGCESQTTILSPSSPVASSSGSGTAMGITKSETEHLND